MVLLIPKRIMEIKEEGRREERERVAGLRARYERGEITLDEFSWSASPTRPATAATSAAAPDSDVIASAA